MKSFCIRKLIKMLRLVLLSVLMNGMTKNALCLPNTEVNFSTKDANIPNIIVKLPLQEIHTIMLTVRDLEGNIIGTGTQITVDHDIEEFILYFTLSGGATGWTITKTSNWIYFPEGVDVHSSVSNDGGAVFSLIEIYNNMTITSRTGVLNITTTGESGIPTTVTFTITQEGSVSLIPPTIDSITSSEITLMGDVDGGYTAEVGADDLVSYFRVDILDNSASGWSVEEWEDDKNLLDISENTGISGEFFRVDILPNGTLEEKQATLRVVTTGESDDPDTVDIEVRQSAGGPHNVNVSASIFDIPANRCVNAAIGTADSLTVAHNIEGVCLNFTLGGVATGWEITKSAHWINFPGGIETFSNMGNGFVTLTLDKNPTTVSRMNVLNIVTTGAVGMSTAATFTVRQLGLPPTISGVSTEEVTLTGDVEMGYSVSVDSGSLDITFTIDILDNTASGWILLENTNFLSVSGNTSGVDGEGFELSISPNNTLFIRSDTLSIVTMGGEGVPDTVEIKIEQRAGISHTLLIASHPSNRSELSYHSLSLRLEGIVLGGGAESWTVSSSSDWITNLSPSLLSDELLITLSRNEGSMREGMITFVTMGGLGVPITIDFMITQSRLPPVITDIILSDSTISENLSVGTTIGTLTTIDPDDPTNDSTYTYMVDNDTFRIEKDTLKTNRELDFEKKNIYTIQITTNDGKGRIFTKEFDIKVEDSNEDPTDITFSDIIILENQPIGTAIGTLTTIDPDDPTHDSIYIYMVNNDTFIIEKDTLKTNRELDFEEKDVYTIQITTNDSKGRNFTKSFDIKVEDVNEKPTDIILSDSIILENSSIGTTIGKLRTIDPDDLTRDSTYIYMINNDTFRIEKDTLKTNRELDFEEKDIYTIQITTNDGKGGIFTKEFDIKVEDTNEKPTDIMLSDSLILENQPIGTVIGTLTTIDPDDPTHDSTYIYMVNNDTFIIEKDTLKTNRELDFEEKDVYTIQITTNDSKGRNFTKSFDIKVEDINEKPTDITFSDSIILENQPIGTVIGTLTTIDPDDLARDSTYIYMINNDTFRIEKDTLKTNRELDFEEKDIYTIQITTNDGKGRNFTKEFDIKVEDINEKPTDIILSDSLILENQPIGTVIGTFTTIDPDDPTHDSTYIYMVNNDTFTIANDTLKTNKELDFEKKNVYTIQITTNDGKGRSFTKEFDIKVEDINEKPTDIILSDSTISENLSVGTTIGTLTTIDPDDFARDSTYIYMINNDTFTIANDTLKTNRELDFEEKDIYTIQITTNDSKGRSFTKEFDIKVGDTSEKPTDIILSDSLILENQPIGTVIGTLTTIDPDDPTHDSIYIYMVNNDTFIIEKDTLKTNRELDFEEKDVYTIQITTNDSKGRNFTKEFDIKVGDTNEKPTDIMLSDSIILENSSIGTVIGTLTTIDPDDPTHDSTYIYMVNNDTFRIEKDTLKTNRELDFEEKDVYTIQITTNDGKGGSFTKEFDIKVGDTNEKPTDIMLSDSLILENQPIGTVIGTLTTIDPDDPTHDSIYIYMVNNDTFIIEKDTLKTNRELDFEEKYVYTIQITTNDGKGRDFTKEFDIKVGDTNEKPTDIMLSDSLILENQPIGTVIGTLTTIDPDDLARDSTYIYMINNDTFTIANDTLKTNRELDFEEKDIYTIQITTNDGKGRSFTKEFDIKVEDINEKPTDIILSDSIILENQPIGTVIGTLTTIDPDDPTNDSTYIYMVNNDTFRIEKDTLKTNRELDFEEKNIYTIQITTNDGKGRSFTKEFDIKVEDINEKPTDIMLSDSLILENQPIGTVIGTLTTIDPDDPTHDSIYIYMVNNDTFRIEKDTLKTNRELDFEEKDIYTIQITTNDGKGRSFTKEFDIKVGDTNEKPTDIMLSDSLILENQPIGTVIGTLTTIDPDDPTHDSIYIYMVNNDTFIIEKDTLKTNRELDFEEKDIYTIQITTNDGKGGSFTKEFDIKVGDTNEKPTDIMLSDSLILENQPIGTVIGTLTTIDPEDPTHDSTYIYMVNNDTFRIEKDTLKTNRELDFEKKNVYIIQITTDDGKGGIFTKEFMIIITDEDEGENTLSIDGLLESVEILPVIVEDVFTLKMDHSFKGEVQLRLYTLNGTILKAGYYHKSRRLLSKSIEVSHLTGGVYVVIIHFDNFTITRKIVKK